MTEASELFNRLVAELKRDIPNLKTSVESIGADAIEEAGVVQSSFAEFSYLLSSPEAFHRHSAFFIYHVDAMVLSLRALREALCSYYGAAGGLLRTAFEAVVRGAFWECLAHKQYRDRATVLGRRTWNVEGTERNVLNWFEDIFQARPEVAAALEEESAGIFDNVSPLFEQKTLHTIVPSFWTMLRQLTEWNVFEPIIDPARELYAGLYSSLSEETHVIPDLTMMGRLIVAGRGGSKIVESSPEEFRRFLELLRRVAEVDALAFLNRLQDDIVTNEKLHEQVRSVQSIAKRIHLPRVVGRVRERVK